MLTLCLDRSAAAGQSKDYKVKQRIENNKRSLERLETRVRNFSLSDFRLSVDAGDIVLITGRNMTGKSTLLQQIYLSAIAKFGSPCWIGDEIKFVISPGLKIDSGYNTRETWIVARAAESEGSAYFHRAPPATADGTSLFRFLTKTKYAPFYFDTVSMTEPPTSETISGRDWEAHFQTKSAPASHRQWSDLVFEAWTDQVRKIHDGKPLLLFYDEPENGLDCPTHRRLADRIRLQMKDHRDIALIATSSPFLIYSDLPRIDLDADDNPFQKRYESKRISIE